MPISGSRGQDWVAAGQEMKGLRFSTRKTYSVARRNNLRHFVVHITAGEISQDTIKREHHGTFPHGNWMFALFPRQSPSKEPQDPELQRNTDHTRSLYIFRNHTGQTRNTDTQLPTAGQAPIGLPGCAQ